MRPAIANTRGPLDAVLREVAGAGEFVSTRHDVIMKLGTKDVLADTRDGGWGSDVHRLDTPEQLRTGIGKPLAAGSTRVLKQWRGHSGIGVLARPARAGRCGLRSRQSGARQARATRQRRSHDQLRRVHRPHGPEFR